MRTPDVVGNMYWSKKLIRGIQNQVIYLLVIYILLGITAIVGNMLILIALHKNTSLHQPSKALLRNLVASVFAVMAFSKKTPRVSILPLTLDLHKVRMVVSFLVCIVSWN